MSGRPRRAAGSKGFTLIEILAVVGIFALLAGIIAPNLGIGASRKLRSRAEELAGRLELARQRAVVTGIPHRVLIDLESHGYRVEWEVTEAEAEGLEPEPPEPLDLRGSTPLPLAAPLEEERLYREMPGMMGKFVWLEDSIGFTGLETSEGWVDSGDFAVEFQRDGTSSFTSIFLEDADGEVMVVEVLPLAEVVRVSRAEG